MPYCTDEPKNPFCSCKGYYGNDYKVYTEETGMYKCCDLLPFPILSQKYTDNISYLNALVEELETTGGVEDACLQRYRDIVDDGKFGIYDNLEDIVDIQRKISNEIYSGGKPTYSTKKITCPEGYIPMVIEYNDGVNINDSYRSFCHKGEFPDIADVSHYVMLFKKADGTDCRENSCELLYDYDHPYNIGSLIHNHEKQPFYRKVWFILVIFFGVLILLGVFIWYKDKTYDEKFEKSYKSLKKLNKHNKISHRKKISEAYEDMTGIGTF